MSLDQLERGARATPNLDAGSIPKILVQFWDDGENVPGDVQECLDSWDVVRDHGISLRRFDDTSARSYIQSRFTEREVAAFDKCHHPAMRSDYFRMCFVLAEGGVYVDADDVLEGEGWRDIYRRSTLKVQPLCYDLNVEGMLSADEIKQPDLQVDDKIFYVNNNPLAAPAGHPVVRLALARATRLLLRADRRPEIQATTGPGNLTASLASHAYDLWVDGREPDFEILFDWTAFASTRWELGYRADSRNWRTMVHE